MTHLFSTHGYPLSVWNVVMNLWWYVQTSHGSHKVSWWLRIAARKAKDIKAISQNQKHLLLCHSVPLSEIMMHNAKNNSTFLWSVILWLICTSFTPLEKTRRIPYCKYLIFIHCWFIMCPHYAQAYCFISVFTQRDFRLIVSLSELHHLMTWYAIRWGCNVAAQWAVCFFFCEWRQLWGNVGRGLLQFFLLCAKTSPPSAGNTQ